MDGKGIVFRLLWLLRSYVAFVCKDVFSIDKIEYRKETNDVFVHYHIIGKRSSLCCKKIEEIMLDNKKINSFSRMDVAKIGQLYGRVQERKLLREKENIFIKKTASHN